MNNIKYESEIHYKDYFLILTWKWCQNDNYTVLCQYQIIDKHVIVFKYIYKWSKN